MICRHDASRVDGLGHVLENVISSHIDGERWFFYIGEERQLHVVPVKPEKHVS
jgi:hypothetical protein